MNYNIETSNELLFIINQFPYSKKNKIPQELLAYLETQYNEEIYNKLDINKPFFKQEISEETKEALELLTNLYLEN